MRLAVKDAAGYSDLAATGLLWGSVGWHICQVTIILAALQRLCTCRALLWVCLLQSWCCSSRRCIGLCNDARLRLLLLCWR